MFIYFNSRVFDKKPRKKGKKQKIAEFKEDKDIEVEVITKKEKDKCITEEESIVDTLVKLQNTISTIVEGTIGIGSKELKEEEEYKEPIKHISISLEDILYT